MSIWTPTTPALVMATRTCRTSDRLTTSTFHLPSAPLRTPHLHRANAARRAGSSHTPGVVWPGSPGRQGRLSRSPQCLERIERFYGGRQVGVAAGPQVCTVPASPVANFARGGEADGSAETTSAAAPARRDLGAERCAAGGPQHSLIGAVAVHHPDSIEWRARPCRSLSVALVGDLVA